MISSQKILMTATIPLHPNQASVATLGGGCFWCLEAVYQTVPGVQGVVSGYAGGNTASPSYEDVCRGETGHAEVVQITFDPEVISYGKIVDLFWMAHDPTTKNRQGADRGTQYRSIILYSTEEEREMAENSRNAARTKFSDPIVTEVVPLERFYPAEANHQDFYESNPYHPYNQAVTKLKVEKFTRDLAKRAEG